MEKYGFSKQENANQKEMFENQGDGASELFKGEGKSLATHELYAESADLFAGIIKKYLQPEEKCTLTDVGSYQGEFLGDVLNKLPEYTFSTVAIEMNENALAHNNADNKIVAGAEKLPIKDASADIVLCRYVLQWNDTEKQKEIIKEIARSVNKIAIIQHAGADDINPDEWRSRMTDVFDGEEIPQLKRGGMFFSSAQELEQWMIDDGIKFERVQERVIQNLSDVFIEKYNLPENEAKVMKNILGDKDHIHQVTWVIFPAE
jgi:SAM-dependent methyltransferase